jgi:hypothetical protein
MARTRIFNTITFYKPLLCLLILVAYYQHTAAQTLGGFNQNYFMVSDTNQLVNGMTVSNTVVVSMQGGSVDLPKWRLTVQPQASYLTPQNTSVTFPVKYFGMQYNPASSQSVGGTSSAYSIGAATSALPLSGSEITLVQQSNYIMPAGQYMSMAYDMVLTGNRQLLLLSNDVYSVVLRFRLYNQNNTLISQFDVSKVVQINAPYGYLPKTNVTQYSNLIQLQNGASNVGLSFSSATAFSSGVETSFTDGLKVSSSDGRYEVKVQTSSDYFTKSGAVTTIPTNAIQVTPSQGSSVISSSTYIPVKINSSQQTLITNYGNQGIVNTYSLKFGTKQNANQSAFTGIESGVYTTQVTFIMNPL